MIRNLTLAQWLTLCGLGLDIAGVLLVARGGHWMQQYWSDAPAIFDSECHRRMYHGAWLAIILGFALQAAGVLAQR